jgi:general secretion pathway protein I
VKRAPRQSAGFTLLEVMVALAIMGIALAVLYRTVGGSARTVGDLSDYNRAVALAESLLQARDAVTAEGWNEAGQWQGFRWSVGSAPYPADREGSLALHRVQIDVTWSDGLRNRVLTLASLRPQQVSDGRRRQEP